MASPPPPPYSLEAASGSALSPPPPLPPRNNSSRTQFPESFPTMSSQDYGPSKVQSIDPPNEDRAGRRRLLLVYIHGFMGDETSFRNFPAHVHNLASITLAESHVVHTKLYPKYRSRYALEVARDDFSAWLSPHEDQWTDVILFAHSMGGLVAADVALLCRHRIIGVVNFDVPFLGMHPGIIKAGLGSIFKPFPEPKDVTGEEDPALRRPSRLDTLFNPSPNDPNFNPSFYNDVHLPVRKGWSNTLHWLNKHSKGIVEAGKGLVQSHLEFGGAMADFRTLKARYVRIRSLEEEDERQRSAAVHEVPHPPRIRFINYYTTATGRPKKPKSPKPHSPSRPASVASPQPEEISKQLTASVSQLDINTEGSHASTSARTSIEEPSEDHVLEVMPPTPIDDIDPEPSTPGVSIPAASTETSAGPELPDIPPIPQEPPFVDLAQFTDRAQRKAAEKEHDQALKEYTKAVKTRNKIINERDKIQEKWEKQQKKDQQLKEKQIQKDQQDEQKQMKKEVQQDETQLLKDSKAEERSKGKAPRDQTTEMANEDIGATQLGGGEFSRSATNNGPYGNYDFSHSAIMNQAEPDEQASYTTASNPPSMYSESTHSLTTTDSQTSGVQKAKKPKRLRKFCMLPPEDSQGNKDPTWVRVFMEGVDEVTAHTSLFFVNDTYERLVGDVGARIEEWVSEADSLRLVQELEGS